MQTRNIKDITERITNKCVKVAKYLLDNDNLLICVVDLINKTNGSLSDLAYEFNDSEFFEGFTDKMEIARAVSMGDYRVTDDWVTINGEGNIDSLTDSQYIKLLQNNLDEIIPVLFDLKDDIDIEDYSPELLRLLNEMC